MIQDDLSRAAGSEPADPDPLETAEWLEAFEAVARAGGSERARDLLRRIQARADELGIPAPVAASSYRNTIPLERQPPYPGDLALEERIAALVRWNALAMVVRANRAYGDLGGHIASYASAAEIFEIGFNHFFRGGGDGDLVFFQPHSSPGVYARAFLEGRLSEDQLAHYRQEAGGLGLCSYPHPWLMPEFWQVPTGSMGLGPISSIYHARFMRYLEHRALAPTAGRRVWGIFGDGEMDEPESVAALTLAARERLDNLTWIVNCNLQRLDGPVRGNGRIVDELERLFLGAGWNVVKVLWGSEWDGLFARDAGGALARHLGRTTDGEYQTLGANDGAFNRAAFFGRDPELRALAASLSDDEIHRLRRGGHDFRKLYAALDAARRERERPTVVLALTKKGYGISSAESRMTAHQEKKLDLDGLRAVRDRFALPLSDDDLAAMRFVRPAADSAEERYLRERRAALGGDLPARRPRGPALTVPPVERFASFATAAGGKEMSTTVALVRMLTSLLRDPVLGRAIVPIVADEARTFGMDGLFRQIGIYAPGGQLYDPQDNGSLLSYRESHDGQLLEEGITEAGALASWTAAATAYSVHGVTLLPFYIFYSMFGFQRVGDLIWAAADQRARGFLIGATAGRTTLGGEGLQHQDGSSHVVAATVPNCRAYDPAFAYEIAAIVRHGAHVMLERGEDVFFYLTVTNERYPQPSLPAGVEDDIIRGCYRLRTVGEPGAARVRLLGSGAILREADAAADLLAADWNVAAEVWSVTSFAELAREARETERANRLHPERPRALSHLERSLPGDVPIVAATDYVRAYPQTIAAYLRAPFVALGTDGFGRSDTRAALRRFFEISRYDVAVAALDVLARQGAVPPATVAAAIARYGIDTESAPSWLR